MHIHSAILTEIQHCGARLTVEVDPERPWSCHFIARLSQLNDRPLIGRGDSPAAALADLNSQVPLNTFATA